MLQLVHIADKLILQSEGKSRPTPEWFLTPVWEVKKQTDKQVKRLNSFPGFD